MRIAVACLLLLAVIPAIAHAQAAANRAKAAVIDDAQADADFAFQGEYDGWLNEPGRGFVFVGLQVVALGDGRFDALLLDGGLPGAGWDQRGRERLSGQLDQGVLMLTAPTPSVSERNGRRQHSVRIAPDMASVRDSNGSEVGRIGKHHRTSATMGATPAPGAKVLFPVGQVSNLFSDSGQVGNLSYLSGAKLAPDGSLLAGATTKMPVKAFRMHLEFRTPYMPHARGQGRGNSGVYIQQRYEVQILDSFGLQGLDNECGGMYKQAAPAVNMCLPPLAWQTYDIWFTPPQFAADGQTKLAHALITVLQNGVPIHWYRPITAKTGGGKVEGPEPFPINLQDHGNPVTFRNIWLVEGDGHAAPILTSAMEIRCPSTPRVWRPLRSRHRW
ncbi:MAG TPA: DUF1080 domain-containing protein [Pirellulaceae bacterium]|nr:DUF1080 domain-containing protein [Pirellulaceae bacterium]